MRKSNPLGSAYLAGVSMRQEVEFLTHEKQKFDGHKQHAKGHENIDGPFRDSEGLVDHAAALIRRDGGDGAVIADDGTDDGAQQAYKRIDHTSYALGQICCDNVEDRKSTRLNSSHVKISYAVYSPHRRPHSFPTRRSSDLTKTLMVHSGIVKDL